MEFHTCETIIYCLVVLGYVMPKSFTIGGTTSSPLNGMALCIAMPEHLDNNTKQGVLLFIGSF
jgi:hypothetical protein